MAPCKGDNMKKTRSLSITMCLIAITTLTTISTSTFAANCPVNINQNTKGYWLSQDEPGWTSAETTPTHIKLLTEHFGGVVFSPKLARLACVYQTTAGQWRALVSNQHSGIHIDQNATDNKGNKVWQWSNEHQDYSCGQPLVKSSSGCPFSISPSHKTYSNQVSF